MANTAMTAKIEGVQDIIDYKFSNPLILWEALQAAGSPVFSIGDRRLFDGNKRLAVLGDIVLDLALAEPWYQGTEPRGRWAQIRNIGTNDNLANICYNMGLAAFVNTNVSTAGVVAPNTASATLEAIIGAVYLDSDMDAVKSVMAVLGLVPT